MTAPLLSVGDATVWPSWFGGHIVDTGDAFPQYFSDRRAAYAEAAARSLNSGATPPPSPGTVPESTNSTSPGGCGSGTPISSSQPHVAAGVEGCAGVMACEAAVAPATNPPLSNSNGAPL